MKYIILISISVLVLFFYSSCVISSRCSKEEEKIDKEMYKNKN